LFQILVYLLHISGVDLILGANWLKTIGPHVADYESLNLKFLYDGKFVTLQGDINHGPMQHIRRMVNTNSIAEVYSMKIVDSNAQSFPSLELPANIEPELVLLLHTYASVFSAPIWLPPHRGHDHSIPLLEGSNPVKVKPYRHPHN